MPPGRAWYSAPNASPIPDGGSELVDRRLLGRTDQRSADSEEPALLPGAGHLRRMRNGGRIAERE
jgi:hypothetical protein